MSTTNKGVIGIIPAGGFGKRMRPFRMWKELIPVGYKICTTGNEQKFIPKVVAEYTLENMVHAGTRKVIVVLNEQKTELLRFLADGNQYKTSIAYMCQECSSYFYGLPIALDTAYMWIKDRTVLMGMPDTIVEPSDCFSRLLHLHNEKKSDLTLGVFPTNNPHRLAPVMIHGSTGRVEVIYDKPKETKIFNTWNIAVWSNTFTELLHDLVQTYIRDAQNKGTEILLSDIFNAAINKGLGVYGLFFPQGRCYDLGNIDELISTRNQIESSHFPRWGSKLD